MERGSSASLTGETPTVEKPFCADSLSLAASRRNIQVNLFLAGGEFMVGTTATNHFKVLESAQLAAW